MECLIFSYKTHTLTSELKYHIVFGKYVSNVNPVSYSNYTRQRGFKSFDSWKQHIYTWNAPIRENTPCNTSF